MGGFEFVLWELLGRSQTRKSRCRGWAASQWLFSGSPLSQASKGEGLEMRGLVAGWACCSHRKAPPPQGFTKSLPLGHSPTLSRRCWSVGWEGRRVLPKVFPRDI